MLKRLFTLLPAVCLLISLGGCAGAPPVHTADMPLESQTAPPAPVPMPTPTPAPDPAPPAPTVATLAVCGDVMSHMPVTNDAWDAERGVYDYTPIMAEAEPYVSAADYAVANLETTLAGGPGYSGYPRFHSPDALAYDLKSLGFDLLLTANNHCMDTGFQGLSRTLDVLDEAGLAHVGTSRTLEEAQSDITVADVGGISVAFLGYTYGTNGIPLSGDAPFCVNLFNTDYMTSLSTPDTDRLLRDMAAARALETDLIAVMIHWGVEYRVEQNEYQERLADLLIENGADLVLGGHPHVLQPMEQRTVTGADGRGHTGFVCYSLGNFISSQNYALTDTTVVLTLELTRDNVTGAAVVTDWTYVPLLMLDRGGGSGRFGLIDAHAALSGAQPPEPGLEARLTRAIEDCHRILGPEHDPRAEGSRREPSDEPAA